MGVKGSPPYRKTPTGGPPLNPGDGQTALLWKVGVAHLPGGTNPLPKDKASPTLPGGPLHRSGVAHLPGRGEDQPLSRRGGKATPPPTVPGGPLPGRVGWPIYPGAYPTIWRGKPPPKPTREPISILPLEEGYILYSEQGAYPHLPPPERGSFPKQKMPSRTLA